MYKKGQVSWFIIFGILLVAIVLFVWYARQLGIGVEPKKFLETRASSIRGEVEGCLGLLGEQSINAIGKMGGTLNPTKFRLYNGYRVNYLCYNVQGNERCSNRIVRLGDIEKEIEDDIDSKISTCLNLAQFSGDYQLKTGRSNLKASIGLDDVSIDLDYPITLETKGTTVEMRDFSKSLIRPLGRLYNTVQAIVSDEARLGDFNKDAYMLLHKDTVIEKHRPYPDKVYVLKTRTSDYIFQFAVEGEPSAR